MRAYRIKINKNIIPLLLILLLMNRCFYLLPTYFISQTLTPEFLSVCIAILWTFTESEGLKKISKKNFCIIFGGISLIILSSIQASNLYLGQSIIDGLKMQQYFLSALFLYYPISKNLKRGKFTVETLINIIYILALIQMFFFSIQFILGPNHMFLNCYYTTPAIDIRVNRIRLYGNIHNITFAMLYSAVNITNKKESKRAIPFLVLALLFITIINQGRGALFIYLVAIITGLFLAKGMSVKRLAMLSIGAVAFVVLINSDIVNNILNILSNTTTSTQNTYAVRLRSQTFYLNVLKEHMFLGGGYPNPSLSIASVLSGITQGFYAIDNGIYGFVFRYGCIGLLWLITYVITSIKNGINLMKKHHDGMPFMVLIPIIIGFTTSSVWYDGFGFLYCVFYLLYAEYRYTN